MLLAVVFLLLLSVSDFAVVADFLEEPVSLVSRVSRLELPDEAEEAVLFFDVLSVVVFFVAALVGLLDGAETFTVLRRGRTVVESPEAAGFFVSWAGAAGFWVVVTGGSFSPREALCSREMTEGLAEPPVADAVAEASEFLRTGMAASSGDWA